MLNPAHFNRSYFTGLYIFYLFCCQKQAGGRKKDQRNFSSLKAFYLKPLTIHKDLELEKQSIMGS